MEIEECYRRNAETLRRKLAFSIGDEAAAQDCLQEAFARALAMRERVACLSEDQLRGWIYVTARNAHRDQLRKQKRVTYASALPDVGLAEDFSIVWVRQMLGFLPEEQAALVSMRYLGGMTSDQIGRMMGVPAATVRTRLRAAARKLRSLMSADE